MSTIITNEETLSLYQEFLDQVNCSLNQWIEDVNEEDFKIWHREGATSTYVEQRVECYFKDVPPDIAYECLTDLRIRKKWDHRVVYYAVLEVTDNYHLHYNKLMNMPIPMLSQRDRVLKRHMHKNWPIKGTHICVARSCVHPDFPPGIDGCIRTYTKMIGYLFQPLKDINGTKLTWIYIDDFRGLIPTGLM